MVQSARIYREALCHVTPSILRAHTGIRSF